MSVQHEYSIMSDILFLYMSNEGCFTFNINHFVWFMGDEYLIEYLNRECEKGCPKAWATVKRKGQVFIAINIPCKFGEDIFIIEWDVKVHAKTW